MYYEENSITDYVVGTLFLGGLFYLTHLGGKQAAYKEIEEKKQKDAIQDLKKRFEDLKKNPAQ